MRCVPGMTPVAGQGVTRPATQPTAGHQVHRDTVHAKTHTCAVTHQSHRLTRTVPARPSPSTTRTQPRRAKWPDPGPALRSPPSQSSWHSTITLQAAAGPGEGGHRKRHHRCMKGVNGGYNTYRMCAPCMCAALYGMTSTPKHMQHPTPHARQPSRPQARTCPTGLPGHHGWWCCLRSHTPPSQPRHPAPRRPRLAPALAAPRAPALVPLLPPPPLPRAPAPGLDPPGSACHRRSAGTPGCGCAAAGPDYWRPPPHRSSRPEWRRRRRRGRTACQGGCSSWRCCSCCCRARRAAPARAGRASAPAGRCVEGVAGHVGVLRHWKVEEECVLLGRHKEKQGALRKGRQACNKPRPRLPHVCGPQVDAGARCGAQPLRVQLVQHRPLRRLCAHTGARNKHSGAVVVR